ncbi:MAG: adenine phosphoribosyltransferase [Lachnospiraceae bacterium]|nr:adenine phosphoribosyltransferase [Lachnospiraceae bacterium]
MKELNDYVRTIPDFPEPGIMFRDITTILQDADGFELAVDSMIDCIKDLDFDVFVLAESRGFIFGSAMAYKLHKPIVLVRKKGKLPCETISQEYELEYGTAVLEMHTDSITKGQRVVIIDDLIATGGTIKATCQLVERLGGEVASIVAVMELCGLKGRKKLEGYRVDTVLKYEGK